MHPYSTNESRISVYASLAVLSVIIAWGIATATQHLSWPQWLVSAPSLAAVFALLYAVFNRFAWKWDILHALGVVEVKNLSGTYQGHLVSTYQDSQGHPTQLDVTLKIMQTWTRISVEMTVTSGSSTSVSTSALGSVTSDGSATCLTYVYRNRVNPAVADADMGDHDGAADLRMYADGRVTGRYFNSRPRAGTIEARKRIENGTSSSHTS